MGKQSYLPQELGGLEEFSKNFGKDLLAFSECIGKPRS